MGILSNFFKSVKIRAYYGYGNARAKPFDKNLYEQEIVRAVIDAIATHAAKAEAMHVVLDKDGRIQEVKRDSPYTRLLNVKPNPIMSGYDLKYKLVSTLETQTTAMCYIRWGISGSQVRPDMMLPLDYRSLEVLGVKGGGYAVRFTDYEGQEITLPSEDVVMLRKFYHSHDIFGDGNAPVYNTLDMVKASDEGLLEALSVSNKVRGILNQKKAMLDPEDIENATNDFAKRFKKAAKNGGIIGVDSMEDFKQLSVTPWSANAAQMKEIRTNILRYWRMSESILMSDYTSSQWQAFYESVIEPILIMMGQAFTNACFTPTEQARGNRILFVSDMLVHMSMDAKTALINATKELGMFTRNEYRGLFGYSPIEGGDELLVSLNYVKAKDQSLYQTGKKEEPEEEPPEPKDSKGGNDDE